MIGKKNAEKSTKSFLAAGWLQAQKNAPDDGRVFEYPIYGSG